MGANQSSKARPQSASGTGQMATSTPAAATQRAGAASKNSFSRQQLNRLLRRSLPTQSRLNAGHRKDIDNKCNPSGNNDVAHASGHAAQSFYGHDSSNRMQQQQLVLNHNTGPLGGGGGGCTQFDNSDERYFVTGQPQRYERLANSSLGSTPNNGLSSKTPLAHDANGDQSSWNIARNNPFHPLQQASRALEHHDQRSLLVRQHQHQGAAQQHHSKSIMTTPASTQLPSQQPFNSSSAYHQNQHRRQPEHQNQHQIHKQQPLQQAPKQEPQQPMGSGGGTNKSNKPQQSQIQQLKSSCSPSSASAASSSTSSGSSAASSSESLRLQRQLDAKRPPQPTGAHLKPNNREHSISRGVQPLVAMQQNYESSHRRSHSSGEPLSWSRQHHQATGVNYHSANDHHQQRSLLANNWHQANQYQNHQNQLISLALNSQQMLSPPSLYAKNQNRMEHIQTCPDDVEQFYSRNLHLLTNDQVSQHSNQPQLQLSNTLGHMSAPQDRRYKWPKQQYQYLNNSAVMDGFQDRAQIQRQQQYHVHPSQAQPSSNQFAGMRYDDDLGGFVPAATDVSVDYHNQSANYYDQEILNDSPFFSANQSIVSSSTLNSGSKSLRKSPARSKSKSRNPLAGIFTSSADKDVTKFGANTVHRMSSSKSHQNLEYYISKSASQANKNASSNSLKRIRSNPMTAQQTSYEAMRTIDMYLIRQIARSCMDFEMEQKIDLEIRLRELAAQSMLEAQTEIEVLEVEKSLLTSDQRMNCYANQLEQQRKRLSNPSLATTDSGRGSKASRWESQHGKAGSQAGRPLRSDVVGASNNCLSQGESGSPNFSLPSKSSQSSPSKLSPVSGESANSSSQQSSLPATDTVSSSDGIGPKSEHSRSSLSRANVIRRPTSNSNTLNRRRKSQRQQHKERLAQLLTSQYKLESPVSADTKATVTLDELRVPLMWRDVDHFKGRGDYRRYAVFCLVRVGSQIYDTQLVSDVDRQMTDLMFDDVLMFNNVELDFELELEVYSCVYLEQFSLSSTPRKLMEKFSNSVGRAMGKRLATQTASVNYIKELEAYDKSYRFAMIASAKLTLVDASITTKTYDLQLISPEAHGRHATALLSQTNNGLANQSTGGLSHTQNGMQVASRQYQPVGIHSGIVTASNQRDLHKNTLPLFGHFCCRLHARPNVFNDKHATSGYL